MSEAEEAKRTNHVPLIREDVGQILGGQVEVVERLMALNAAEHKLAMDGTPPRVRQTRHIPAMMVPTRSNPTHMENVYLFEFGPHLPDRTFIYRTCIGSVKRRRVQSADRNWYARQGDDTLSWALHDADADTQSSSFDATVRSLSHQREMVGLSAVASASSGASANAVH